MFGGGLISTAALTCLFGPLDGWTERWIESKHKPDFGKFVLSSGKFYGDQEKDKGLQTSQDAWFYALSARFATRISGSLSCGAMLPPPARGVGSQIPSAQRLGWAAKQRLGNAALGALFA